MSFHVTGCDNCPIAVHANGKWFCRVVDSEKSRQEDEELYARFYEQDVTDHVEGEGAPEWCPMKTFGSLTYEFVDKQQHPPERRMRHLRLVR